MMGTLLIRGMLVGVLAGVLAFGFASIYGEPLVDQAIAFEEQHAHANEEDHHHEEGAIGRQTQAGIGLLTGLVVFGVALGGVFAIAFAFLHGRLGTLRPLHLSVVAALTGFATLYMVPSLKYSANPPAVGAPETISERTLLFFGMILISAAALVVAVHIARRLSAQTSVSKACLAGLLTYTAMVFLAWMVLPSFNEASADFSTDLLSKFRLASFGVHAILWATLGIGFGLLTERGLRAR